MTTFKWLAIDFDETIADNLNHPEGERYCHPMPDAQTALKTLKERGWKIMIHSLNRPKWIDQWMAYWDIPYDAIWEAFGKPPCDYFIDDRAIKFEKNWPDILESLK